MEFDDFLSSQRWEILQLIAEKPMSPIEIAEKLNTTVSYVSQQLKLLFAAGLISKEKTGASEKGKPRTLFRISNEIVHLTTLTEKFSWKKLIYLTEHHRNILSIWMIEDSSLHILFERLFWKLYENIKEIRAILLDNSSLQPRLLVVSDSKTLKTKIDSFAKSFDKKIDYSFVSESYFNKNSHYNFLLLYERDKFLTELKGGDEK